MYDDYWGDNPERYDYPTTDDDDLDDRYANDDCYRRLRGLKFSDSVKSVLNALIALKKKTVDESSTSCGEKYEKKNNLESFCAEDKILSSDISIELEEIGKLHFPLELPIIENMLAISEKASFGNLTETCDDTEIRDTLTIHASKIKVDINDEALAETLSRMKCDLNLDKTLKLKLHLHNLLLYGPGQFFDLHRDSEKVKNMVATLIFILPSKHDGGELVIKHKDHTRKVCSSSSDTEHVKVVMFYSDCEHEVKRVSQGYRVVLTYNVELEPLSVASDVRCFDVDVQLENSVLQHFSRDSKPKRLIVVLDHLYSEESLKWELMKGEDRTVAEHLRAIGMKHNYKAFLALSHNMVLWVETECDADFTDSTVRLYFWVDDSATRIDTEESLDRDDIQNEVAGIYNRGFDYSTPIERGWYGNGPAEKEHWYHSACVVLLAN